MGGCIVESAWCQAGSTIMTGWQLKYDRLAKRGWQVHLSGSHVVEASGCGMDPITLLHQILHSSHVIVYINGHPTLRL